MTGSTEGDKNDLRAFASTMESVNKKFVRYVNRRAKEGHNLYFNVRVRHDLVDKD